MKIEQTVMHLFTLDDESALIDQHGNLTRVVFIGEVDITKHVLSLTISYRPPVKSGEAER